MVNGNLGSMVPRRSARGHLVHVWEPDLARIRDEFLDCVIYLYPDRSSAEAGEGIGGSGFLVGVQSIGLPQNFWFLYAVTNKHVVQNGATALRLSTRDGKTDVIETDERSWVTHPSGDDLAACLVSFDPMVFKFHHVPRANFLTHEIMDSLKVGPGDEVFVVGRFISHEGKQQNRPTAQFGFIAQMPHEPIVQDDGFEQESFLVEVRSIGGYSGSPVFLYVMPVIPDTYATRKLQPAGMYGEWLLGIEWGLLQNWEPVRNHRGEPVNPTNPRAMQVPINTGMMGVVPVWKLAELLDTGPIAEHRKKVEKTVMEHQKKNPPTSRKTSASDPAPKASPPANDANPSHQEDFMRLVGAAARKQEPED